MGPKKFISENIKIHNDRTAYILFLTNDPKHLDDDLIVQTIFPDSDDAGCIFPPRGFGEIIFTDDQMKNSNGVIELIDIRKPNKELRHILNQFDALVIDDKAGMLILSVEEIITLMKSDVYKYAQVFEIDNQI